MRNHGDGIIEEESQRRKHRGGNRRDHREGIREEEPQKRNHRGGSTEEES